MKKERIFLKEKLLDKLKNFLISRDEIIFAYIHWLFLDIFPFRDIDIAVYVESKKIISPQAFDYSFQLSVELLEKIGKEVDIQVMNYTSLGFQHSVFKNGKLLFGKDEDLRLDLMEIIYQEYMDFYELSLRFIRDSISWWWILKR